MTPAKLSPLSSDDLASLSSFPPATISPALARLNMCDFFAFLLEDEVKKKTEGCFGAEVEWKVFIPKAPLRIIPGSQTELDTCAHSVLVVKERNGRIWAMDGTGEQFGWDRSFWLLSLRACAARMATTDVWFATDKRRSRVEKAMQ